MDDVSKVAAKGQADKSLALVVPVDEAAEMLSLGRVTIYKLVRAGKLEVRHFGRATRITLRSIEKLVNG
jgi:excisionase family DNA binding protein